MKQSKKKFFLSKMYCMLQKDITTYDRIQNVFISRIIRFLRIQNITLSCLSDKKNSQ